MHDEGTFDGWLVFWSMVVTVCCVCLVYLFITWPADGSPIAKSDPVVIVTIVNVSDGANLSFNRNGAVVTSTCALTIVRNWSTAPFEVRLSTTLQSLPKSCGSGS